MTTERPVVILAKGLLRASGKAAIDTCGGTLVGQPVTLVALQVELSNIVTFIVKRFKTKTVFVSKRIPMAIGESKTGMVALAEQSVASELLQCLVSMIETTSSCMVSTSLPTYRVRVLGSKNRDWGKSATLKAGHGCPQPDASEP